MTTENVLTTGDLRRLIDGLQPTREEQQRQLIERTARMLKNETATLGRKGDGTPLIDTRRPSGHTQVLADPAEQWRESMDKVRAKNSKIPGLWTANL